MDRILWIDLEMTGLDPEVNVIIEAAAIVTDASFELKELDHCHFVIRQHKEHLDKMDSWNTNVHKASGLSELIPTGKTIQEAEDGLVAFVENHFKEPAIIAGNSISQDRSFIKKYFHKLESKLHYRMLDVTAWKLLLEPHGVLHEKKNIHRALSDIQESVQEMRHYLQYVDKNKLNSLKPD